MNSVIETRALTRRFGRKTAVDQVTLTVPTGSVFALMGANGAGKSTLIRLLMNILPPSEGEATVLRHPCRSLAGDAFREIAYVAEDQEQPDWMTVRQLLDFCRPFYPAWDEALAADIIRQFDLPLDHKLKHLSRGMRMKAVLASSLAYRPKLIVLDEPFGGLDPLVRDEFVESLLDRAEETTILISSHDLAEIESFASHAAYLEDGRLVLAEDLPSLANRMREVNVTLENAGPLPAEWPRTWLNPQVTGAVVRFVETQFHPEETPARITAVWPGHAQMDFRPLPLREIFLALAKSKRSQP
ncbi:MAG: ABC transporter ATP-binding protein [Bryobacteraceae bacterium]|nr:ABC transporter ATP-binding protein [Bryobacteraceae bacterium]